jgi:hypothetical protein
LRAGAVAAPPWGGAEAIGEDAEAEGGGVVVDREVVDDAADTHTLAVSPGIMQAFFHWSICLSSSSTLL